MSTRTFLLLAALLAAGCDSEIAPLGDSGGPRDAGPDAADSQAKRCTTNAECGAGVCMKSGTCCPTEQVCGNVCCGSGTICYANACVKPGKECFYQSDCEPNQYCEPGLGPKPTPKLDAGAPKGDGGTAPDGGRICSSPPPRSGRCIDLPPKCPATDAGAPPMTDAGTPACYPACEFRPPKGKLETVVKWSWGPVAKQFPEYTDVWATPTVARLWDANCDGKVNELDPPSVIFVSGDAKGTCCSCDKVLPSSCLTGVLRVLDGASGKELWSLRKASASSTGFAGFSIAVGDVDGDGKLEIAAVTGERHLVLVSSEGKVLRTSDQPIPIPANLGTFGWGGALAIADMDGDGAPELAFGATVFSSAGGKLTLKWTGAKGVGGGSLAQAISTFVDLDGAADNKLELLAGRTAYKADGSELWHRADLPDGFPGVGDFDGDGKPEAVLVANGQVWVLAAATGATLAGPFTLPGGGEGGAPTVADFDKDGKREIGVAMQNFYSVVKPDLAQKSIGLLWKTPNHDLSSSVTGSTVFDFEGDGEAEVIYNDECFLWVYEGKTGAVRFAAPTTSFTATEASLVADVDGDGHAEMLMVSNGANPGAGGWKCDVDPWNKPDPASGRPAWVAPSYGPAYRGLTLFADRASSWVATRTLWNQHTYHVTNICDPRDSACDAPTSYGAIPKREKKNWTLSWLNNFRQNVQDKGLFDAPDATVTLAVPCKKPVLLRAYVRNLGLALLPAGVELGFYVVKGGSETLLGTAKTSIALLAGQAEELTYAAKASDAITLEDTFVARLLIDPKTAPFRECWDTNNASEPAKANCILE
jgi:hypothetical protein